ncbi:MAG: twin-arginine translocase subunit TatC [Bradymonadia bacterium]
MSKEASEKTIPPAQDNAHETPGNVQGPLDPQSEKLKEMPFMAHFIELRARLFRIILAILIGTLACFSFAPMLYGFLAAPIFDALPEESRELVFLNPVEPFFVYLKISILSGFILTSPYVFFQIWRFIAPGLYAREKRLLVPLVASSTVVFLVGAIFCYLLILPLGLKTLIDAGITHEFAATAQISMASYYDLVVRLIVAFGIVFEMPIFSWFMTKLGVISSKCLVKHWRMAVVIIFIVAAILTPPDVITQLALGLPMCLLYGVSILLSRLAAKPPKTDGRMAQP